ncbi:MAG: CPBP family intramembrane metalloprotease [Bacteroidetes bacterium]|nr:CPBP family intramembrane metalloprotease [Bacteroidota bacterium]
MSLKEVLKTKVSPVIVVIVFVLLIGLLSEFITLYVGKLFNPETIKSYRWINLYINHFFHMVFAIVIMLLLGGGLKSYGITLKSKNLYILPAIFVGMLFGVVMLLVDHFPTILSGSKITGYDLNTPNVIGWLSFEWVFAGLSEEIVARGLMMTYLMKKFNGHIKFLKWDIHVAGVIVAVLFALMHISSFWSGNLIYAIGQQLYALILGLCFAYFYEKSKSLVSPIIAHNVSNGIEFLILFLLIGIGY